MFFFLLPLFLSRSRINEDEVRYVFLDKETTNLVHFIILIVFSTIQSTIQIYFLSNIQRGRKLLS